MLSIRRCNSFAKRLVGSITRGFVFLGSSRTKFPKEIWLAGRRREIARHGQSTEVHDLIDVVLDDSYGLRSIEGPVEKIVDIGTNIGLFSLFAREMFPQSEIHSYEPDPTTGLMAKKNLDGVAKIYLEGVSEAAGKAVILHRSSYANANQVVPSPDGDVELVTIDEVVARIGGTIDLLKVDCEGAEWSFMREARSFRNIRAIRMEYHLTEGENTIDDVVKMASMLGYDITKIVRGGKYHGIVWLDRPKVASPEV